ncbi:hypothetical protein P10VF_243 [Rhizobium phage vB_RleM_P10VF]|uniref:Uncharacterized protein n=1 Tax=Rhizobium phage vB_RleM_P10VF TaxID=1527770 RepID=A0A076YQF9_9CAUD|nr:hypothetical protein P10VF_243 [Rhizobium phage vB_RleM_P10VF]AIK68456.1 hypothetical protein P10VF_243 [Rhizobium phage vB_RleM_P10VF]
MQIIIDNSSEIFGAKTTVADLAYYHDMIMKYEFETPDTDIFNIYIFEALKSEYKSELKEAQIFECDRFVLTFKDGSKITIIR